MIEERIELYIKLAAINKIKGFIKCRFRNIFKEYDTEVDKYIKLAKIKFS